MCIRADFFAPLGRVEEPPIRNTSTFHQKYLYFLSEIPLLFIENTSTFSRKFLYFSQDVFLLRFGSHSTSSPKYLHFLSGNTSTSPCELLRFLPDVMLFLSERLLTLLILKSIPHRKAPPPSVR